MSADWYPPGLRPSGERERVVTPAGAEYSRLRLTPESALSVSRALRGRSAALRQLPVERILGALDRTHLRLRADPGLETASAAAAAATGYASAAIRQSLACLFAGLCGSEMEAWLAGSGITPGALDGIPDDRKRLVFGPELTVVISSGNLPGTALPSVVQALLLKSPVLLKTGSSEPALLPLYASVLAEEDPQVAAGLVVTGWPGGASPVEDVVLREADAVVAYGSDATLRSLRERLAPRARFIGYGHRVSVTAIARESLTEAFEDLAGGIARDAAVFDQQGCLSPRAVYVESGPGIDLAVLARRVSGRLEELAREMPRRPLQPDEAAAIHQYRAAAEMRALQGGLVLSGSEGTEWTVTVEPGREWREAPPNRTVILREMEDLADLPDVLAPLRPALISCGLAAPESRRATLVRELGAAGFTRITRVGAAQFPADLLHHDGVSALAALARFVSVE